MSEDQESLEKPLPSALVESESFSSGFIENQISVTLAWLLLRSSLATHSSGTMFSFVVNGTVMEVEVLRLDRHSASVRIEGRTFNVSCTGAIIQSAESGDEQRRKSVPSQNAVNRPLSHGVPPNIPAMGEEDHGGEHSSLHTVYSPLPGVISSLLTGPGCEVEKGDVLMRLEAMKMQNNINAPCGGVIEKLMVNEGEEVGERTVLAYIKPRERHQR